MWIVPWWALLSSGCAPVVLVGAWMIAEQLHGPGYEPVTQTISLLGADGAGGQWVLNGALIALGVCHLVTAWGLRAASLAGRLALGAGGLAAIVVALSPEPTSGGSLRHGFVVGVGFTLLAVWPVLAATRAKGPPWALRPAASITATALMGLGAASFLIELQGHGAAGVAERVLTTAQSLWPFVVVASCLRHARSS
ncbi:DUF998 domain-containing protein [Streptomyces sp. NPDC101393]|uniref:DUF998 domain-containing protein n=1 Tax=Streptomyces sp. NPDC101393 TaxID=3366141 RepID=UPI00381F0536